MKHDAPITEIMTTDIVTISPHAPLSDAERILFSRKFKHLPVVSNGKLVGIITKTDVKRMSFASNVNDFEADVDVAVMNMLNVGQVMVSKPFTVQKTATIRDVAKILSEKEFRSIPIMDGEKLIGMVTTKDLIRHLMQFL